ncbi:hypothetical protein GQ457_03G026830 [Hibiscus cannabinus]
MWDEVYNSVCWNVRDGMNTDFWYDTWIASVGPLAQYFIGVGDPAPCNVASMACPTGQWDFARMSVLLPESILYRISAIRPPHPLLGNDAPSWRWMDNQNFSSKVTYDRVAREGDWIHHTDWKVIWKMVVPQRIRMFLWLAKSEKLLTNKERVRRHLIASPCCPICFPAEESVLHVLRDCVVAGNTWRKLVRPGKLVEFMALPFNEWLVRNLRGRGGFAIDVAGWGVLFPTICWTLWKSRCKQVMEPDSGVVSEPLLVGHPLAAAYVASAAVDAKVGGFQVPVRRWCKPRARWVKANADGASCIRSKKAAAGCVIRDEAGSWLFGFTRSIRVCSSLLAEVWAVHNLLLHAWNRGFWCVELETDNMEVVEILNSTSAALLENSLVNDLREFLARDWNVVFWHISREQNKVADALAALGRNGPIGVALYEHPPASINRILVDDSCDMSTACAGG